MDINGTRRALLTIQQVMVESFDDCKTELSGLLGQPTLVYWDPLLGRLLFNISNDNFLQVRIGVDGVPSAVRRGWVHTTDLSTLPIDAALILMLRFRRTRVHDTLHGTNHYMNMVKELQSAD